MKNQFYLMFDFCGFILFANSTYVADLEKNAVNLIIYGFLCCFFFSSTVCSAAKIFKSK